MLKIIRDIRALVALANSISAEAGVGGNRWSLFLTNRSFIALVLTVLFGIAAALGLPLAVWLDGASVDQIADGVIIVVSAVSGLLAALTTLWGLVERLRGKTRAVWNRRQALKAVEEAKALAETGPVLTGPDPLAAALREAGVKVP